MANVESLVEPSREGLGAPIIERLALPTRHLRIRCVHFHDITDRRNNLVHTGDVLPYTKPIFLHGNILLCSESLGEAGLFVLKEAPPSDVQLAYPGFDFVSSGGEILVAGMGLDPSDLDEARWTRAYGFVTGVATGAEEELLLAIRNYQHNLRIMKGRRDNMVMLNTWGDRSKDAKMSESFVLAELEAGARLGVTHLQLDHGWERTHSEEPGFTSEMLENIWNKEGFWDVHPVRFPEGLGPVVSRARELGIELCIWFNPARARSYENWERDADVLIKMNREHGIRTFKIDGVVIPDKRAEVNLRAMLDRVMEATDGEAVFDLDVTAGKRFGYHYFYEYGNLFLENRYTDWSNYYPHWTLRNLWQLARYVPPQRLQIEFLNKWRNSDNYPADDPLAPSRVPFDYCFATTMMAQPLAWFEASQLPEEAFASSGSIKTYLEHQEAIHAGRILPIGEEPQGTSWTGFQSIGPGSGYLVLYREYNDRASVPVRLWGLEGKTLECESVTGYGRDFAGEADEEGRIGFTLPAPFTFALYRYGVR